MNHEELLEQHNKVLLDPVVYFKMELNERYNRLCYAIWKNKKNIRIILTSTLYLIQDYWEYVEELSYEQLYMVLNVIKVARSQNSMEAIHLAGTDLFRRLDEEYSKLR